MKKLIIIAIASIALVSCKAKPEVAQEKTSTEANSQKMEKAQDENMPKEVYAPAEEKEGSPQKKVESFANDEGMQGGPAHLSEEPRLLLLSKKSTDEFSRLKQDPYTINNVSTYQTQIIVSLSYSGGCGEANFSANWNGMLMKSMPPKANISLNLDDQDDCESMVNEKIYIDIAPLLKEVGPQGVMVRLQGWDAPLDFTIKR